jgi:arylsulfatase A-like enzyme
MGEDTSDIFFTIFKNHKNILIFSFSKILLITWLIFLGLQFASSSFSLNYKILFGFIFFIGALLRVCALYPGISENWMITQKIEYFRNLVQFLSTLKEDSRRRQLVEWLPFIVVTSAFCINFFIHMKFLISQSRLVKKARSSIYVNELDTESRVFSIQGVSFVTFFIFGSLFLYNISSSFKIKLPDNNTKQNRPNIFIFAIDSLRYDRFSEKKYDHVLPFLKDKIKDATLFKPMLVGIPRTFPSWVEIATGSYSVQTGVRSMFPSRSSRISQKETIFQIAKNSGYSTIFVSDFAGDIFPRYPFGATDIHAPTCNLESLTENGILTSLSPIQAVLTLPHMQRILPSLLESPEIADPRLVGKAMSNSLAQVANISKPLFLTVFFSSAHFPYAAPGPWYSKFQEKDEQGKYIFKKNPDQKISQKSSFPIEIPEKIKKQTIALYDGGLNAIDATLKNIFQQLEEKEWLKNSIILIFGDHGENLYEGNLGMGHGDGVQGEYSNVTPLIIFTQGNAKNKTLENVTKSIVRTIDIAPTIAKRTHLMMPQENLDGEALLDVTEKAPNFPSNSAYMETGIWFTPDRKTSENQTRIVYPSITRLLDLDKGMNYEFFIKPAYTQSILGVKERAWINEFYRLIIRSTPKGNIVSLYSRSDKSAQKNLLNTSYSLKKHKRIAKNMLEQMNHYLRSQGLEIIENNAYSFFYAENASQ